MDPQSPCVASFASSLFLLWAAPSSRDAPLSHTHAAPLSLRSRTLTHRPSEHEPRPPWRAVTWSQTILRAPGTAGSHFQVFSAALSFARLRHAPGAVRGEARFKLARSQGAAAVRESPTLRKRTRVGGGNERGGAEGG